jgi:hypothetical protein
MLAEGEPPCVLPLWTALGDAAPMSAPGCPQRSPNHALISFQIGDAAAPAMYFGGVLHSWEWGNACGLLRLAEVLCEEPHVEGLDTGELCFRIVPIRNPYGFSHFVCQNGRGVDLALSADLDWDGPNTYPDVVHDVAMPWGYCSEGTAPASEPETRMIRRILDAHDFCRVMDFHAADYRIVFPYQDSPADEPLMHATRAEIRQRLMNRYICQAPYNGP